MDSGLARDKTPKCTVTEVKYWEFSLTGSFFFIWSQMSQKVAALEQEVERLTDEAELENVSKPNTQKVYNVHSQMSC